MPTNGRYQSRVFSFLSQQSLRLRDQSSQAWRRAKTAAVWGVQVMLYPIYVGFQSARLVGRQLQQAVQTAWPRLQAAGQAVQPNTPVHTEPLALPGDRPIRQTLDALNDWLAKGWGTQNSSGNGPVPTTAPVPPIQGIASLLPSCNLVLVTPDNETLDILTLEQQAQLQRTLIRELATYWRQRRMLPEPSSAPLVNTFLPLPKDRPTVLPLVRAFRRLMAWEQLGGVAIATNLFQEARRVGRVVEPADELDSLPALAAHSPLRTADVAWLSLEEIALDLFQPAGQPAGSRIVDWLRQEAAQVVRRTAQAATQVLEQTGLVLYLPAPPESPYPDLPDLAQATGQSPWLSMDDLFGQMAPMTPPMTVPVALQADRPGAVVENEGRSPQPVRQNWATAMVATLRDRVQTALTRLSPTPSQPSNPPLDVTTVQAGIRRQLAKTPRVKIRPGLVPSPAGYAQSAAVPGALWVTDDDDDLPISPTRGGSITPAGDASDPNHALAPTWIEAEAEIVGYVKHPLEQLLEWLDLGMVWIERRLARTWHWVRDRWLS